MRRPLGVSVVHGIVASGLAVALSLAFPAQALAGSDGALPSEAAKAIAQAQAEQKVRPIITVPPGNSWPYNAVFPLYLTINGQPLDGTVHFGVSVTTPTGSWVDRDVVDVIGGKLDYSFTSDDGLIGQSVTMTFFVDDDENYLASSTTPRTYQVIDLPVPVLTFNPAPIVPHNGEFSVKVSSSYVPASALPEICMTKDLGAWTPSFTVHESNTACVKPQNGVAKFPFDVVDSPEQADSLRLMVYAKATSITRASSLPHRYAQISEESPLHYSLPRSATLRREGVMFIVPSHPSGSTSVAKAFVGTKFYMDVLIEGRAYRFIGSATWWNEPGQDTVVEGVPFRYSLPASAVGKKARIVVSNALDSQYQANSSSERYYEIVK
ncbi:MAG: hypothetical protein KDB26_06450 [Microthrixaceae bacterium]|nr:hypothetical protein [Microthrixaceae bacterium]